MLFRHGSESLGSKLIPSFENTGTMRSGAASHVFDINSRSFGSVTASFWIDLRKLRSTGLFDLFMRIGKRKYAISNGT